MAEITTPDAPAGRRPRAGALAIAGAALVFAALLLAAWATIAARADVERQRQRQSVQAVAQAEAAAFALRVDGAVSAVYPLAALLRQNDYQVDPEGFAAFATALMRVQPGISSLQYAPDGVIRFVEPVPGNEAAIGVSLLTHPVHAPVVKEIIRQRALTLTGPFELAQGGQGAVARLPIFLAQGDEAPFWGFAQVLIRLPELLEAAGLQRLTAQGLDWRLSRLDADGQPHAFAGRLGDTAPASAEVPVANGRWLLELAPTTGWMVSGVTARWQEWAVGVALATLGALLAYGVLVLPSRLRQEVARRTGELALASERLDLALAGADLGLWDWQPRTDRVEFNERWRRIVGAPAASDLPGRLADWWPRVHPEDRAGLQAAATRQISGESDVFEVEFRLQRWDQSWIWVQSRGRVVERDADGRPVRAAGTSRDVTAERAATEQLRLKSAALEVAANAIMITRLDGAIEWVNPAFTQFTGYTAAEVRGRNPRLLKSGLHEDALYANLWQTIVAGEPWHGEMINRRKDGSMYHEIQTITPVRDAGGAVTHYVTIKRDVTARRDAEATLRQRERLLDAFFSLSLDGFFFMMLDQPIERTPDTDPAASVEQFLFAQRVTRVNQAMLDQYGSRDSEFMGRTLADFFRHDLAAGREVMRELLAQGRLHTVTEERRIDGTPMWIEGDYTLLHDDAGRIVGHFGVQRDITERRALEEELTRLATTDLLTGLPNRRHLMARLAQDFARFRRAGVGATVLMLDLDHFKKVNDTHGHAAGDEVLRRFAATVSGMLRQTDTVGRLGGEEFAVLLHGTGEAGARVFAERLRAAVEHLPIPHEDVLIAVTVSVGVAVFSDADASIEAALARADAALYRAKTLGRNRVEIHPDGVLA